MDVSFVSLILSVMVLVNYCPTQGLTFDYMGVIVGILALLVTALVGAQVGQYVFVDRKIEKITRTLALEILLCLFIVGYIVDRIIKNRYDSRGSGLVDIGKSGKYHQGEFSFKYRNRNSAFNPADRILLHKGLWKALNVNF